MKQIHAIIDRPLGSRHPEHPDLLYTVNYGFIPGMQAGDGEAQDVYILGIDQPLKTFEGEVIAVIRRRDDVEEKWVAVPRGLRLTEEAIREQTAFVERFFDSNVELLPDDFAFLPADDLTDGEVRLRLRETKPADPARRFVPAYWFDICLPDGTAVGACDLRIGHTPGLFYGGNIGYRVEEPWRGHRYAAKACRQLFRLAHRHALEYVYITCSPENPASERTCELAGGTYICTADLPKENDMYQKGERRVMIYRFEV